MIKSVVTKLWILIFALILVVLLFFSILLSYRLEKIYFSQQVRLMTEHGQQWKNVILNGLPPDRIQQEMEFWGGVSHYNIAVFDDQGFARYSSDIDHIPIGKKSDWIHVKQGTEKEATYYTGFNPELKMEMTATFLPFINQSGSRYLIMVHAPTQDLLEMITATRITGFAVLVLFFVLSGALVWYFSRLIAKPLIDIRKVAMGMAKGDFSNLIAIDRNDELGDLGKSMNILSIRLKKTLDSLHRSNSELNTLLDRWKEFVADVSHDLRTPLFLLQGYSEALTDGVIKDEETKKEYLAVINKETLRLQKLVNDLLAVESGLPLNKVPTSIYELATDTIKPFEISAREKGVSIQVDPRLESLQTLTVDPDKLGEVIYNLVDNALRYTPHEGKILIAGQDDIKTVKLTISDTGTGIAPNHLPHLFDRFYRVDKSRSRAQGGSGLGLAIVKKIVELHGGTITVKSKINKGTSFIITLPVINNSNI